MRRSARSCSSGLLFALLAFVLNRRLGGTNERLRIVLLLAYEDVLRLNVNADGAFDRAVRSIGSRKSITDCDGEWLDWRIEALAARVEPERLADPFISAAMSRSSVTLRCQARPMRVSFADWRRRSAALTTKATL